MNILCIGESKYNIDLSVEENKTYNNKSEYILGISLISSYLLGSWGESVYYHGIVGKDIYGKKIVNELKSVGVKIKYIEYDNVEDTSLTLNIIKDDIKETIDKKITKELKFKEYKFIPDIIFSDGTSYKTIQKVFTKYKSAIKLVYIDNDNQDLVKVCKSSNYIIFTIDAAEKISKIKYESKETLESIYSNLKEKYNKIIIIDLESSGTVFEYSGKIKLMGKIKTDRGYQKKNKDIFYGALLYGISKNIELEKTIKIATIAEYVSLKKSEKSIFIPELEEVYEIYSKNK